MAHHSDALQCRNTVPHSVLLNRIVKFFIKMIHYFDLENEHGIEFSRKSIVMTLVAPYSWYGIRKLKSNVWENEYTLKLFYMCCSWMSP